MKMSLMLVLLVTVLAPARLLGAGYLKFEGVDGEVTAEDHRGWCHLGSFVQTIKRSTPVVGGTRLGAPVFEDLACVKELDKASPKLAEAVCNGKVFPSVQIHLTLRFTEQEVVYLAYELKNVRVTSYQLGGAGDSSAPRPHEQVAFNFEEIKVTYTEYDAQGRKKGNVEYSWKVEAGER
jgi:type VI secretion system Hcp family effector